MRLSPQIVIDLRAFSCLVFSVDNGVIRMQDNSEKRMVSGWWIVPLAIGGIVIWGKALMMIFA